MGQACMVSLQSEHSIRLPRQLKASNLLTPKMPTSDLHYVQSRPETAEELYDLDVYTSRNSAKKKEVRFMSSISDGANFRKGIKRQKQKMLQKINKRDVSYMFEGIEPKLIRSNREGRSQEYVDRRISHEEQFSDMRNTNKSQTYLIQNITNSPLQQVINRKNDVVSVKSVLSRYSSNAQSPGILKPRSKQKAKSLYQKRTVRFQDV